MPYKILLADDSITIQKVIGLTLSSEEFQLIVADNGDEAFEKAIKEKPSLIIADTNMPGLNGYELCEKVRGTPELKDIPLILLVGTYETFDSERAKRVGANDHITKPFESQQLIKKIRALLQSPAPAPPPPPAVTSVEPEEAIPLEPLELEEIEPEPIEISQPPEPPQIETAPTLEEILPTPPTVEPSTSPSLDFGDLEAAIREEPVPSQGYQEAEQEVTWNLEEFEGYLAATSDRVEREKVSPPPEEVAVDLSFEETFSVPPPPIETAPPPPFVEAPQPPPPPTPPPSPEPPPPFLEVSPSTTPLTPEAPPHPSAPFPPTQPPLETPQPPPSSPPIEEALRIQIEARVRSLITERISALLEEVLPKAIDEAIHQGVERVLKRMVERWGKGGSSE